MVAAYGASQGVLPLMQRSAPAPNPTFTMCRPARALSGSGAIAAPTWAVRACHLSIRRWEERDDEIEQPRLWRQDLLPPD